MAKGNKNSKNLSEKTSPSQKAPEEENDDEDALVPEELLEGIPQEDRGIIQRSLTMMSGRMPNPISKKITSEHIGKLIDNSESQDRRESKDKNFSRIYHVLIILIALAFVSFLIYTFRGNNEVLVPMITGILAFLGGLGVGKAL